VSAIATTPRTRGATVARVALLALGPAAALGLGRFAYALLLPAMRTDLGWSYAQAGVMNTANAVGYLVGAIPAAWIAARFGSRRAFVVSLAVIVPTLLASAATGSFVLLAALRLIVGVAGAVTFIVGAGLVAHGATGTGRSRAALLLGVFSAGPGIGIVASGAVVPPILSAGPSAWPVGWLALGGLAALALAACVAAVRDLPEPPAAPPERRGEDSLRPLAATVIAYGVYGAGYIAYATFIIAYLANRGVGHATTSVFWIVLGSASVAATFAWRRPLGALHGGHGPALTMAVVLVGVLIPLVWPGGAGAMLSAVLFGGAFLALVTAVTGLVHQVMPAHAATRAIGALTIAFAIGQCAGPLLAGVLSDGPSGLRAGLELSAAIIAAAILIALAQPPHGTRGAGRR
jgi:predicted MFS family arabinose efflux permease